MLGPLQEQLRQIPSLQPFLPLIFPLLRVTLMLGAAFLAYWVGNALITRVFNSHNPHLKMSTCKAKTLQALFKSVLRYAIYFFVALTVVEALGVPTGSIIASAGIVGLAIGFGAQNLVRDVITGFFILMEDQFGVGEYIEVFGVAGEVEEVGLRITKLRDFSGALHIVPNGSIDRVTNHHRGALRALVDVRVLHEEDPERVQSILAQVAAEVAKEVPTIVEGPRALGIADVTEAGMIFRIWARTQPMEQWAVEREIRRRVKLAFDREGIHTPYPRTVFMPQETANPRMIDD